MTFRTRLLLIFAVAVAASVGMVELIVSSRARRAFEAMEARRVNAIVAQFDKEFQRRGEEIVRTVEGIANSPVAREIAITPDPSAYLSEAGTLASTNRLDLLELVDRDGAIVSSAQWQARFGYKEDWLPAETNWQSRPAFLKREELPDSVALALVAVRTVVVGDMKLYVAGGRVLDREFVASLVAPEGMRVLLYRNLAPAFSPADLIDSSGPVASATLLRPLIEQVEKQRSEAVGPIGTGAAGEIFHALPLKGSANEVLGVLLVGNSRRDLVELESSMLRTAVIVAVSGILMAIVLGWWATARVTRPVRRLAESAGKVAAGNWGATVAVSSTDEIGQLAGAFNRMTHELVEQRERLVQAERVAAWRELARRLAHELKNPLFPLQITVENMQRARASYPEQFDEVFREGTSTLLAELANLKQIIGRFSDFAKMPAPEMQPVNLNALATDTMRLFEAQLAKAGIRASMLLDPSVRPVQADGEQMTRVLRNLILNAVDAMPEGGTLTVRTAAMGAGLRLEVSDTGQGLTPEECERLFTPYYTTKTHGTGLGLAIVQSVVSDHKGRIAVESEKGKGTTFRIDLG
ncbi:MAG TPA: ATP-binding protein [Bryobacteraceae bacterium]|jgi:signal transduction histidine kinase|nr:ATP-binding protein [Bryobacteraceae bacterium]